MAQKTGANLESRVMRHQLVLKHKHVYNFLACSDWLQVYDVLYLCWFLNCSSDCTEKTWEERILYMQLTVCVCKMLVQKLE